MLAKLVQPRKTWSAIFVSPPESVALVSEVQPLNAPPPVEVTLSGRIMPVSEVQPEKAQSPMSVSPYCNVTVLSPVQPLNVLVEIVFTVDGIVMLVTPVQSEND